MSADNIAQCPRCKDWAMREFYETGIIKGLPGYPGYAFFVEYKARCHACDFSYEYKHAQKVSP